MNKSVVNSLPSNLKKSTGDSVLDQAVSLTLEEMNSMDIEGIMRAGNYYDPNYEEVVRWDYEQWKHEPDTLVPSDFHQVFGTIKVKLAKDGSRRFVAENTITEERKITESLEAAMKVAFRESVWTDGEDPFVRAD